jgi:uncharacterized protein (DUF1697 family)
MVKYVALLRGVNVGGRTLRMNELKACLEALGLEDVKTVLQSGNAVFNATTKDANMLRTQIEEALTEAFSYPAKVFVITTDELKTIVAANPYNNAPADEHQYIVFFSDGLEKVIVEETEPLLDASVEAVQTGDGVVYWRVKKGQTLKSVFGKALGKAAYRNNLTNRNVNTLQKILSTRV